MVIGMLFGATIPAAGISGAVLGILLWYAFDRLLDVTLPLGTLAELTEQRWILDISFSGLCGGDDAGKPGLSR